METETEHYDDQAHELRETRDKSPDFSLEILYGPHGDEKDAEVFADRIKQADIFIPEFGGYPDFTRLTFQKVSNGTMTPKQAIDFLGRENITFDKHLERELEILYQSGIGVALLDRHEDDRINRELCDTSDQRDRIYQDIISGKAEVNELRQSLRSNLSRFAGAQRTREKHISRNMRGTLQDLIEDFPNLRNRDNVKVVMALGYGHTEVYRDVRKQGIDAKKKLSAPVLSFDYHGEVIRRFIFGKEVNQELIDKVILEIISYHSHLMDKIPALKGKTTEQTTRKAIDSFSPGEFARLFNGENTPIQEFEKILNQKGFLKSAKPSN